MPRRPPEYPLPRGVKVTSLVFGRGAFGDPLGEWGYQTPELPEGISGSALERSDRDVQSKVAEFWFRLNCKPFDPDRPWFTLGVSLLGGPDRIPPETLSPQAILTDEFQELIPAEVLDALAAKMITEAVEQSSGYVGSP